jgi:hypothetical protein
VTSVAGRTGAVTLTASDVAGVMLGTNNLSDISSPSAARTNLGLGTAATTAATAYATAAQGTKADAALAAANNLSDLANAATARTNLGLGTAATTAASNYATAAQGTLASGAAQKASNLSDLASPSAARTSLGLGTAATTAATAYATATQGTTADNALPKAGGTMTGNIAFGNHSATGVKVITFNGEVNDGNSGAALTVDFTTGQYHLVTLTGATPVITLTPPGNDCVTQLRLAQDATGSRVPTFSPALKWDTRTSAADKLLTTTASAVDLLIIRWVGSTPIANLIKNPS